jgi:hypothetical protein
MLRAFAPFYDYTYGVSILRADEDELLELKLEAARRLAEETSWGEARASALVQILSLSNLEIPRLCRERIGLDVDSCNILGRLVLEEVSAIYLGYPLAQLAPLQLPPNRILCVLSTPLLNILCGTLSNPLADVNALLDDNSADEVTLIEILLAAYRDYAREQLPRAQLFPRYANKAAEAQILKLLSKDA